MTQNYSFSNIFSSNVFVYVQSYFLTIGFLLGTGVLGLPVTLAKSGLTPFLLSFTVVFAVQFPAVYLAVDVLQKCSAIQVQGDGKLKRRSKPNVVDEDRIPLNSTPTDDGTSSDEDIPHIIPEQPKPRAPDFHLIGEQFLPNRFVSFLFDAILVGMLLVLDISYALAGSQAYAELFGTSVAYTIIPFCWLLNLFALFGKNLITPTVSIATFFKAIILTITVVVAFIVGSTIHREVSTDFQYIGKTVLLSNTALFGAIIVMPLTFGKLKNPGKSQIASYRLAVNLGLCTTYLIDILWTFGVLYVVPQSNECHHHILEDSTEEICPQTNFTLEWAAENGQISTVPFTKVIKEDYSQFSWVAWLITVFIVVSITVSYTIAITSICQTVEGFVASKWPKERWNCMNVGEHLTLQFFVYLLICLVAMTTIFCVAYSNPKGFLVIIEYLVSLTAGMLCAWFLPVIFWNATKEDRIYLNIPAPLSKLQVWSQYSIILFYNLFLIYTVVVMCLAIAGIENY
ncbi:uncharacterized protein [Watersipora subatra]|uniref:uncharacterized protein n=1 Tax=Watersipora subatra TaxID=2589382 RepID=UPI00355B3F0C